MFAALREDFRTYLDEHAGAPRWRAPAHAFFTYGFLATLVYRYVRWTRRIPSRLLRLPFTLVYLPLKVSSDLALGIQISANADIGPGLHIGHHGGIFLHCNAGHHLSVGQGVTIGYKGAGKSTRWPRLGDNVYIGAGAKVIGDITIGNGVVIGANTVVTRDVPARMRVVGAAVRMSPLDCP
ncbi:serine O-acetyltransferase [Solilutibacter silvestris]|uniref:Serine acetyltransferase n=1 Tax=Solilutibacter silvestris TaxID=1645665 RepID=A0A2K1PZD2_9GAMM|nr:serine acetyltransferase [Lysobacter silvestris]PNS08141.1 Serine acetyltransferase [Lysobacter silvestris]